MHCDLHLMHKADLVPPEATPLVSLQRRVEEVPDMLGEVGTQTTDAWKIIPCAMGVRWGVYLLGILACPAQTHTPCRARPT